jgi:hypothetical protein
MKSKDTTKYVYFCVPVVIWGKKNTGHMWLLFREPQTLVGDTGWSYTPPGRPEYLAYRNPGDRTWNKAKESYLHLDVVWSRKEFVPEDEVLAILLAAR